MQNNADILSSMATQTGKYKQQWTNWTYSKHT